MKSSYLWVLCGLLSFSLAQAQTVEDVLRYSVNNLTGSARYKAMGGAFGALGGDLSALNSNPAGSAVFNNSQFAITGYYTHVRNDATYNGTLNSTREDNVDINQLGAVFVIDYGNTRGLRKLSFAVNYEESRNFDDDFLAFGQTDTGLDTYFLGFAQGVPLSALQRQLNFIEDDYLDIGAIQGFGDQQAFLGLEGGFISPAEPGDPNNTAYVSNADYQEVRQAISIFSQGETGKLILNTGLQFGKGFYLGGSINGHWINREQTTLITESGYAQDSPLNGSGIFDNRIGVEGTGVSAQVGFIARVAEVLRLGASIQSPTYYWITENTSQRVNSNLADPDIQFINFDIANVFPEYRMRAPGQATISGALVFGKVALVSADLIYRDYSTAQLGSANDAFFAGENQFIQDNLATAWEYRLGNEFRIGDVLSLRTGYRLAEGAFTGSDEGQLEEFSGGIGMRLRKNSRLDVALASSQVTNNIFPIEIGYPDNVISRERNQVIFSVSYIANF